MNFHAKNRTAKWIKWSTALLATGVFAAIFAANQNPQKLFKTSGTDRLLAHEWGTFTTVHMPDGKTLGSINYVEDYKESVLPDFVHRITEFDPLPIVASKNNVRGHPDVTMRLETPVLYFYPPENFDYKQKISVDVVFNGGILNEFYPAGDTKLENLKLPDREDDDSFLRKRMMDKNSKSYLSWKNFQIGGPWDVPQTDVNVWLAPRRVKSAYVKAQNGEAERYIFYRGLANLGSLIKTTHNLKTKKIKNTRDSHRTLRLQMFAPDEWPLPSQSKITIPRLWVVHIKGGGKVIYKEYANIEIHKELHRNRPAKAVTLKYTTREKEYEDFSALRKSIKKALMRDGLFEDEAEAMLNTWNYHYFNKPGGRVLFILPKEWAEEFLPIKISVEHDIVRSFIGRIDLQGVH